jgi:hypothetical protein
MGTFTMPLWKALDLSGDDGNGLLIGLDDYPIYDEKDRIPLNRKIIRHYWNREVGQETLSMFRFAMSRTMHEQMPYFNQLYLSTKLEFDPLSTYDLQTIRDGTATDHTVRNSTSDVNSTGTGTSRAVSSTTPQTMLAGRKDYATSATDTNSKNASGTKSDSDDTSTSTSNSDDTSRTVGRQGSASALLTAFRSTILNLDMNVIDALGDCFMLIWDNGDELLPSSGRAFLL